MAKLQSSSQTAGPYVHIEYSPSFVGLDNIYEGRDLGAKIFVAKTSGNWITISGQVTDGDGMPVTDAMLEFWQADSNGTYNQTGSSEGWGRRTVDAAEGRYSLRTIMPGRTSSESVHIKV